MKGERSLLRIGGYLIGLASRLLPEPMTSVAAPVLNNRRVVAALSVVAQSGNLQPAALTPAVVAVARAMTSRTVSMCGPLNRARKNQSSAGSPNRAHSKSSSAVTR